MLDRGLYALLDVEVQYGLFAAFPSAGAKPDALFQLRVASDHASVRDHAIGGDHADAVPVEVRRRGDFLSEPTC